MRKIEARLFVILVSLAAAGSITAQQKPAATGKESRITGLLLGTNQKADAGRRVLLIKVRLLDEMGREIPTLPPKADAILDALVTKPVATAQSDSSGRFQFRAVKAGRYSVGVTSKPDGTSAADDVTLLRRMQDSFNTIVFDVAVGQTLDLGSLSRNNKRNQTPLEARVRGAENEPGVSLERFVSAEVTAPDPFAGRFDIKGKQAVVIEVGLSGPARVATISSADFAFRYEVNGTEGSAPCVGLYKGFGIWDLASRGPVTDERDFSREPNQRLLFLVPTGVTRGRVVRARSNESVEVKAIGVGTGK
jgi:hypothetical protein